MEDRRLLALSTRPTSPGQRFRIQTWSPYLAAHGIRTRELAFAAPSLERALQKPGALGSKARATVASALSYPMRLAEARGFDASLVYREAVPLGPPLVERWLSRRGQPPMAFDVDDPIFFRLPPTNPLVPYLKDEHKWRTLCEKAAVTICINEMIADHLRSYCQKVEVIPNALDLTRYRMKPAIDRAEKVVGYSGSPSTMPQIGDIRPALEEAARAQKFTLEVVGGKSPVPGARELPWSAAREVDLLHGFDIGLAPAPEDQWSHYKSFVKVLLYMAVGLPVIASPVGIGARVIVHGENGLLARTQEEWTAHLIALLADPDLRARIGRAARATIERDYALDTQLPRVLSLFRWLTEQAR